MKIEAGVGEMWPQGKEHTNDHRELEETRNGFSLESPLELPEERGKSRTP